MSLNKKFIQYQPETEKYGHCTYLKNADGDWYEQQVNFKPDTLKILYDDDGKIVSTSDDVSKLVPVNLYVAEVPKGTIIDPKTHRYVKGKVVVYQKTHDELASEAEAKKQYLIADANQKTQMWQTQLMLDIIKEEDKASLKEWMLYVQEVQAVDPSLGAAVVWPTPPASPAR